MTMDKYILDAVRTLRAKKLRSSFGEIFTFIKCHDDSITIDIFRDNFDRLEEHGYIFKKNKTDSYYLGDLSRKPSFLMANNISNSNCNEKNNDSTGNSMSKSYDKKHFKELKPSLPMYGYNGHKLNEQEEYNEVEKFYLNQKDTKNDDSCGDKNGLIIKKCSKDLNKMERKLPNSERLKKLSSSSLKERKTSSGKQSSVIVENITAEQDKGDKNVCEPKDKNRKMSKTEMNQNYGKEAEKNSTNNEEKAERKKKHSHNKEDLIKEKIENKINKQRKISDTRSKQNTSKINSSCSKTNGERVPRKLPSKGVIAVLQTDKLVAQMLEKLKEGKRPDVSDIQEREAIKNAVKAAEDNQELEKTGEGVGEGQHEQHKNEPKHKHSGQRASIKTNENKTRQNSRHRLCTERKKSTESRSRKTSKEHQDKKLDEGVEINMNNQDEPKTDDKDMESFMREKINKSSLEESDDEGLEIDISDDTKNKTDLILSLLNKERENSRTEEEFELKNDHSWIVTETQDDSDQIAALLKRMKSDYAIKKKSAFEEQKISSIAENLFEHSELTKIEEHVVSVSYDVAIPKSSNYKYIFDVNNDDEIEDKTYSISDKDEDKDMFKSKCSMSTKKTTANKERCSKVKSGGTLSEEKAVISRKDAIVQKLITENVKETGKIIPNKLDIDANNKKSVKEISETKTEKPSVEKKKNSKEEEKMIFKAKIEAKDASTQTISEEDDDSELIELIKCNLRESKKKKSQETKTRDQLYIGFLKDEMDFLKSEIKHKNEFISKLLAQKEEEQKKKDDCEVKDKNNGSSVKKDPKNMSSLKSSSSTKSIPTKLTLPSSPVIESGHKQKAKKENFLMKENFIENNFLLNDCHSDLNNNENKLKQNNKNDDLNSIEKKTINDSIYEKKNNNENASNIPRRESGRKTWKAPSGRLPRVESMVRNLNQSRPKVTRSASMNNASSTTTTISSSSNYDCATGSNTTTVVATNDEIDSKTNNKKSNIVICHIGCNDLSKNVDAIPNLETLVNRLMKKTPQNKMMNSLVPKKERAAMKKKYPIIWKI